MKKQREISPIFEITPEPKEAANVMLLQKMPKEHVVRHDYVLTTNEQRHQIIEDFVLAKKRPLIEVLFLMIF
jgi:hypothetical protein